jgi:hypothetical protein
VPNSFSGTIDRLTDESAREAPLLTNLTNLTDLTTFTASAAVGGKPVKAFSKAKQKRRSARTRGKIAALRLSASSTKKSDATLGAEIALSPGVLGSIAARKNAVKGVLAGFGKAVKRAKQSQKSVQMTVVVDPRDRTPSISVQDLSKNGNELEAALMQAQARGTRRIAEILSAADMMSADEFGRMIGATRETVHQKRHRREILGLQGATRGVRFPEWQLTDDGGLLPGLPQIFAELGNEWSVYRFLLQHHPELGGNTALDTLKAGRIDQAINAARNVRSGAFS